MPATNSTLVLSLSEMLRLGPTTQVVNSHEFEQRKPVAPVQAAKRSGIVLSWPLVMAVVIVAVSTTVKPWRWIATQSAVELPTAALPLVQVTQPVAATTTSVTLPGTVRPWQTTSLHARVNGFLKGWYFDLGAEVHKGDLLAEIDTPELDEELAQNTALAREAEAAVVQARAERVEAEADLKVAQAELSRVQAELNLANNQLARRELLLKRKAISEEDYDLAVRQAETQAAGVAAAESDLERRRANLETRDAMIASRESTAQSRRSNVQRLKELQAFQKIIAPFDGIITKRVAEVGMLVAPNSGPLFAMDDMSRVRVQIHVPQSNSAALHVDLPAIVSLPESAERGIAGRITRMANSVEVASRTMLAEIELTNENRRLQPGSYSQVTLELPQQTESWTIPTKTLAMRVDGPHVVVVNESDRTIVRRVNLGRNLGNHVVVTSGIDGGERLVVNPTDDLQSGRQVNVMNVDGTRQISYR